jgi:uncharacterized protein (DUF58 family)
MTFVRTQLSRLRARLVTLGGLGVTPTTAILIAAASLLVTVLPLSIVVLLILGLVAAAVIDALGVRHLPTVERRTAAVVSRAIPSPFHIAVTHRGARRLQIRQAMPADVVSRIEQSGNGSSASINGSITALRRGVHQLPAVAVRSDGTLGLGRWYHQIGAAMPVEAHADLPTAHRLALAVRRGVLRPTGERLRGPLGLGTEFESLREYRPDDDSRLINWRATARLGKPTSNNLRIEQDQTLVIAVDCGRLQTSALAIAGQVAPPGVTPGRTRGLFVVPPWAASRLDSAFDVVSALSMVADELNDRCGFVAYHGEVVADVRPVRRGAQSVLRAALPLEPHTADPDHVKAFAAAEAFRPTVLVVCTDVVEPASVEPLLTALRGLATRRRVLVVTADDVTPELHGAARDVNAQTIADREAAMAMVRATGARVIHGPPHLLAELTVRSYLNSRR